MSVPPGQEARVASHRSVASSAGVLFRDDADAAVQALNTKTVIHTHPLPQLHRPRDFSEAMPGGETLLGDVSLYESLKLDDRAAQLASRFACGARVRFAAHMTHPVPPEGLHDVLANMPPTPAAVDPLLTMLQAVRALDRRISGTLAQLGVDAQKLPPGLRPLGPPSAPWGGADGGGGGMAEQEPRLSLEDLSADFAAAGGCGWACGDAPPLRQYLASSIARRTVEGDIAALFAFVLGQKDPMPTHAAAQRGHHVAVLAQLVATVLRAPPSCGGRHLTAVLRQPPWATKDPRGRNATQPSPSADMDTSKRGRDDNNAVSSHAPATTWEPVSVAVDPALFASDIKAIARGLRALAKSERSAIAALTSGDISTSFAPHAKEEEADVDAAEIRPAKAAAGPKEEEEDEQQADIAAADPAYDDERPQKARRTEPSAPKATAVAAAAIRKKQHPPITASGATVLYTGYNALLDQWDLYGRAQHAVWVHVQAATEAMEHAAEVALAVQAMEHRLWLQCEALCVEHDALLELRAILACLRSDIAAEDGGEV